MTIATDIYRLNEHARAVQVDLVGKLKVVIHKSITNHHNLIDEILQQNKGNS